MSNANAVMGSALGAAEDKAYGESTGTTIMNFGMNVANGAVRNQVAYNMRRNTGSNLGFMINNMAGYGYPEANARGTMGLMGASIMTSMMGPWGGGYGCGPMMGGMWGGSPFYGGGFGGGFGGGMMGGGYGGFGGGSVFGGGFGGGCCGPALPMGGFHSYMNPNFFPTAEGRFFFNNGRPYC